MPAYVLDRDWDAIAWNRAAGALFVGWLDRRATGRNLLHYMFRVPGARQLIDDWPSRAARLVAEFRADAGGRVDDAALRQRLADLRRDSPEFARLWDRQDVLAREGGERVFNHPVRGRLLLHQLTLRVAHAPDLKWVMLS